MPLHCMQILWIGSAAGYQSTSNAITQIIKKFYILFYFLQTHGAIQTHAGITECVITGRIPMDGDSSVYVHSPVGADFVNMVGIGTPCDHSNDPHRWFFSVHAQSQTGAADSLCSRCTLYVWLAYYPCSGHTSSYGIGCEIILASSKVCRGVFTYQHNFF